MEGFLAKCFASPDGAMKSLVNGDTIVRARWQEDGSFWLVEATQGDDEWERVASCFAEYEATGMMFARMHRLCS